MKTSCVILCGGSGERLWPISSKDEPKQFLQINKVSLIENAILRAKEIDSEIQIVFVCNLSSKEEIKKIAKKQKLKKPFFIIEPSRKDTGPAIILATKLIEDKYGSTRVLVLPSDQFVKKINKFKYDFDKAEKKLDDESILIFGKRPDHPSTEFGYFKIQKNTNKVLEFKEKPKINIAKRYFKNDIFFWNCGMFFFKSHYVLEAYQEHNRKNYFQIIKAYESSSLLRRELILDEASFRKIKPESFDYSLMEKIHNIKYQKISFDWSDIGNWNELKNHALKSHKNNYLNIVDGNTVMEDSERNIIFKDGSEKQFIILGVDNLIIAEKNNKFLISKRDNTHKLKSSLKKLDNNSHLNSLGEEVHRPWGKYKTISLGKGFQVKVIEVYPGQSLSLQMHQKREEHWQVLDGKAEVYLDNKIYDLQKGEKIFIPKKSKHRLTNKSKNNLVLLETQFGSYLGEDDIKRFEDIYGRK